MERGVIAVEFLPLGQSRSMPGRSDDGFRAAVPCQKLSGKVRPCCNKNQSHDLDKMEAAPKLSVTALRNDRPLNMFSLAEPLQITERDPLFRIGTVLSMIAMEPNVLPHAQSNSGSAEA